jgi:hypothetical protein
MDDLRTFIDTTRDARELKRALAIQLSLRKHPWNEIVEELGVSRSFISKWRSAFKKEGPHSTGYCNTCCMKRPHGKLLMLRSSLRKLLILLMVIILIDFKTTMISMS